MDPNGNLHPLDALGLFAKDAPEQGVTAGEKPPEEWPVFTVGQRVALDGHDFEITAMEGKDLTIRFVTEEAKRLDELGLAGPHEDSPIVKPDEP